MLSRRRSMMASSTSVKGSVNGIIQDDWKTIGKICQKGPEYVKKYYKVGDVKPVSIDGEGTIDHEIIGIGVQDKADGTGKAAISWFPKAIPYNLSCSWHSSNTYCDWPDSSVRSLLNNQVFLKLPAELQKVIVPVDHTEYGYSATDKIWTVVQDECLKGGIFYDVLGTKEQRKRRYQGEPYDGLSAYWWTLLQGASTEAWAVNSSGAFVRETKSSFYPAPPGFTT